MDTKHRSARDVEEFVPGKGWTPVADLTREDCLPIAEDARQTSEALMRAQRRESVEEIEERSREARLRRRAHRHGLSLQKSCSRTPRDPLWGTYQLIDPDRNTVVAGHTFDRGFGLSLDEIEEALAEEPDS